MEEVVADLLTQDCITSIPSLTTPHDASNSSLVSSVVCAAAEPDILWETFANPWKDEHQNAITKHEIGAYLIANFADLAYGLDSLPSEVSVEVGNYQLLDPFIRRTRRRESPQRVSTRQRDIKGRNASLGREKMGGWRLNWESFTVMEVMKRRRDESKGGQG
ncbi:phloem protein 2-B13 [Actinidia rufa]|uniref:Phloem protein 2-B13 n=1 Tax=Actinidia rufa TaxID=165716 RepID=A0A7J0H1C4_9ERIC|nr:phloem protein 2-B13 [Actinidia rufa]